MKPTTRKLLVGSGIAMVLGAFWFARPGAGGASPTPPDATPVELVAPGMVEPIEEKVELAFETSGRVALVAADEGDRVQAGQLLARLDDSVARARVAQAEAALSAAEARRDRARRGARPSEIRIAQAEADAAAATAREAELARDRAVKLRERAAVGDADVDRAKGDADTARAQSDGAAARLALVRAGTRDEDLREAEAAVEGARAELELQAALLAQTELRAPRDGVVLRRFVETGEQVTMMPPTIAFTLADTRALKLRAEIDEGDVARVRVGMTAWATADAFGDERFQGRIVGVSSELGRKRVRTDDPRARVDTRVLEVLVAFEDGVELPLGMRMELHVETE